MPCKNCITIEDDGEVRTLCTRRCLPKDEEMKMTGLMHNNIFYKTWWITNPEEGYNGIYSDKPEFDYDDTYHVVEKQAYDKCLLDLNEMTAKYNFMVDSAQQNAKERDLAELEATKHKNAYSAEAVASKILGETVEKLQDAASLELWGLNVNQILQCVNFYEAQTGKLAREIK